MVFEELHRFAFWASFPYVGMLHGDMSGACFVFAQVRDVFLGCAGRTCFKAESVDDWHGEFVAKVARCEVVICAVSTDSEFFGLFVCFVFLEA